MVREPGVRFRDLSGAPMEFPRKITFGVVGVKVYKSALHLRHIPISKQVGAWVLIFL